MNWTIRTGGPADAAACHAVYVDAVRNGTSPLYSPDQAMAWAPSDEMEDWMPPRLEAGTTWIAVSANRVEGFLTVTPTGHLDFFFVRPQWRGQGVSQALYDWMMDWAKARETTHMTTDASHLARRFLERRGWRVTGSETVFRNGVALDRWQMAWDTV